MDRPPGLWEPAEPHYGTTCEGLVNGTEYEADESRSWPDGCGTGFLSRCIVPVGSAPPTGRLKHNKGV
jgi:hypothetical protein